MTHNQYTRDKVLISGGCVISGKINFEFKTFSFTMVNHPIISSYIMCFLDSLKILINFCLHYKQLLYFYLDLTIQKYIQNQSRND